MSWTRSLAALCGTVVLLTGCGKHETVVASSNPPQLPTHAQPRLPTLQLYVGPEELSAEVARGPREIMTGMMFRTNVVDGDAMLFVLPSPRQASFWMMNCPSPLSCAYIDPEGTIQEIHDMEPFNTNSISSATHNILFVLETGPFSRCAPARPNTQADADDLGKPGRDRHQPCSRTQGLSSAHDSVTRVEPWGSLCTRVPPWLNRVSIAGDDSVGPLIHVPQRG